jgi:hypothetical protein
MDMMIAEYSDDDASCVAAMREVSKQVSASVSWYRRCGDEETSDE